MAGTMVERSRNDDSCSGTIGTIFSPVILPPTSRAGKAHWTCQVYVDKCIRSAKKLAQGGSSGFVGARGLLEFCCPFTLSPFHPFTSERTGVPLIARREVADEKVVLFAPSLPLPAILSDL